MNQETKDKMGMDRAKSQFIQKLLPMLEEAYDKGIVDFTLRMQSKTHFIVHSLNVDGKTVDIVWKSYKEAEGFVDNEETLSFMGAHVAETALEGCPFMYCDSNPNCEGKCRHTVPNTKY